MKIEVGKRYINANGQIIEIVKFNNNENLIYSYGDTKEEFYTNNGMYSFINQTKKDLICEVNEDIYTAYKQDLITKKEFLNKHFELYS